MVFSGAFRRIAKYVDCLTGELPACTPRALLLTTALLPLRIILDHELANWRFSSIATVSSSPAHRLPVVKQRAIFAVDVWTD